MVEFAAGVQDGKDDFDGGHAGFVHADRDAAAVVGDGDTVVEVDRDADLTAVSGKGLVHTVVDNLINQMVQAALTGVADVHTRTLLHRFEAFQDGDVALVILRAACLIRRWVGDFFRHRGRSPGLGSQKLGTTLKVIITPEVTVYTRDDKKKGAISEIFNFYLS